MNRTAIVSAAALLACLPGCAHYYWPMSQLESPEAIGPDHFVALELAGVQSGSDLISPASPQASDPKTGQTPSPVLSESWVNYSLGVMIRVTPELDLGVRIQPSAPLMARGKYQFYGPEEGKGQLWDTSISGSGSGGLLIASENGTGVTFYTINAAVIGGLRLGAHHLVSLAPFFSLAGLSGVGTAAGSGTMFGGSLGYQYDAEALIVRAEVTYGLGSFSQTGSSVNPGGIFPGLVVGLKL